MDLSENKEHQYLNALKIPKNTVIGSVATPLLRIWFRRVYKSIRPLFLLKKNQITL